MFRTAVIWFMMCFCVIAGAQIRTIPLQKLESVNEPALSADASLMVFETTSIKAETMSEDDGISTFVYRFENMGTKVLNVKRLVSTCSCAVASIADDQVQPGMKGEITVRYNPKGHPGKFERRVFVYTDDSQAPSAILRLSVDVERGADLSGLYPVPMGSIRLRNKEITLRKGVRSVERRVFVNVTDRPLKIQCEKAMLPSCLDFRTEPEVVSAGAEGEIVITYDPAEGGERGKMPVILKGLGVPPSQSALVVTFE